MGRALSLALVFIRGIPSKGKVRLKQAPCWSEGASADIEGVLLFLHAVGGVVFGLTPGVGGGRVGGERDLGARRGTELDGRRGWVGKNAGYEANGSPPHGSTFVLSLVVCHQTPYPSDWLDSSIEEDRAF